MKTIIGLGAEGVAAAIYELIGATGKACVVLLTDDDSIKDEVWRQPRIFGPTELLPAVAQSELSREFFVGVSSLQSREKKRRLYEYGVKCGLVPLAIVHPRAVVSRDAVLGAGHTVLAGAIIGPYTQLQENVTVNMGAMIESRCLIRPHAQLAAGCWIGSGVTIGEGSYIGSFAGVEPNVRIGDNVVIGPGAVVTEDVPDGAVITAQPKPHEEQTGRKSRLGRAARDKEGLKMALAQP